MSRSAGGVGDGSARGVDQSRPSRPVTDTKELRDERTATTVVDLTAMVEVAHDGIVSKAIVENDHHKIVHFSFAAGQELSEHTASVPAVIHILQGRGTVVLAASGTRRVRAACTTCRPS